MGDLKDYGIDLKDIEKNLFNLIMSGLDLSDILDYPTKNKRLVEVDYNRAAEKIFIVQNCIKEIYQDFDNIKDFIQFEVEGKKEVKKDSEHPSITD